MSTPTPPSHLWQGLTPAARALLTQRDYSRLSLAKRLATTGVEAGELTGQSARASLQDAWIPGVEIFSRTIYPQRHRGSFGEFVRRDEPPLGPLGLWPAQWAAARMFAGTAKGFHIHPPHIPEGRSPAEWFQALYGPQPAAPTERPYAQEQWDVMFFVQGAVEMLLVDERLGLPRRTMRFLIEGDDHRGPHNVGVIIPPGVAHALRVEGPTDAIMVYGTSTSFNSTFEGRLADSVERAPLPPDWESYLIQPSPV